MIVEIAIVSHLIDTRQSRPPALVGRAGALVEFTGIVRSDEDGQPITALEYEAYQPMAEQTMLAIIEELGRHHPNLFVSVVHRIGIVPVGEAAIHIVASATHRTAALAMVGAFLDRLKQDVPIWKIRALATTCLPLSPEP